MKSAVLILACLVACGGEVKGAASTASTADGSTTAEEPDDCGASNDSVDGSTPPACILCHGAWTCPGYGTVVPCVEGESPCVVTAGACIDCAHGSGIGDGLLVFCQPPLTGGDFHVTCTP